jgi:hypothetical protein
MGKISKFKTLNIYKISKIFKRDNGFHPRNCTPKDCKPRNQIQNQVRNKWDKEKSAKEI